MRVSQSVHHVIDIKVDEVTDLGEGHGYSRTITIWDKDENRVEIVLFSDESRRLVVHQDI